MNRVADEILSFSGISSANPVSRDILMHYGVGHDQGGHSGRYPWGSGGDPYQRMRDWRSRVKAYEKQGLKGEELAKACGCKSTKDLRAYMTISRSRVRAYQVSRAESLVKEGHSKAEIAKMLDLPNESSVRALLDEKAKVRASASEATAEFLKQQVAEKKFIDVTAGAEYEVNVAGELGISRNKMDAALEILKAEGYQVYARNVEQVTNPGKFTKTMILCPPGTEYKEMYAGDRRLDSSMIKTITDYHVHEDPDGNDRYSTFEYPASMDSSRLKIRYSEEGGLAKDGLIEIRPGVKDLDLNGKAYSQVRILVDDTHYLKGMAAYGDPKSFPDGVDVIFNTNKTSNKSMQDVLKPIKRKADGTPEDNPFGSLIKEKDKGGQYYWYDDEGKEHLSLINKRSDEGDWKEWGKHLPSQFLVKQNRELIQKQLNDTIADKRQELDDILSLTNPTVQRKLLQDFAETVEGDAVKMRCNGFPEQRWHVIIPVDTISDKEIFAPNYPDGTKLALVRYPHGGTFEIPIVTVNNKNAEAMNRIGSESPDAVGISAAVANRLSGADFDGDTVMCIPCNAPGKPMISTRDPLPGLVNFEPKIDYAGVPGCQLMKWKDENNKWHDRTQDEMGKVTNLLCDMQLVGCSDEELERAVKHSMVVIDAAKHGLDYKRSEEENGIKELRKKYQIFYTEDGRAVYGGSTIITRADKEIEVAKRKGSARIDPETGRLIWKDAPDNDWTDADGKVHHKTQKEYRMLEERDPEKFISRYRNPKELLYAEYAKSLLAMADEARIKLARNERIEYNAEAAKVYAPEVATLMAQLKEAESNSPRERAAQRAAGVYVQSVIDGSDDNFTKKEQLKVSTQALAKYRVLFGAHRTKIDISERQWEAIQAGAISDSALTRVLRFADADKVRAYATPRASQQLTTAQINRIQGMRASSRHYTAAQIAEAIGVSVSTVQKYTGDTSVAE